ncbi:MAG: 2-oxoglutarate dehydrogenase E1 component [Phycisphaerales bacterium]|nr:2-oxoglutarate dehydrogenase E1 component [Phycisphaerales bacterium]
MATARAEMSVNGWNPDYVEALYRAWQADPDSVDAAWRPFFQGFELGLARQSSAVETPSVAHTKQARVDSLVYHYRDIGHLAADLDPLDRGRPFPEYLMLESFGLSDADMDSTFDPGVLPLDNPSPLRAIVKLLEDTYCRHIGVEYMHIQDRAQRRWLQKHMEGTRNRPAFESDRKMRIFRELSEATNFEEFLNTRYLGKKRFGLDGGESLNPILWEMINLGPALGIREFTIGMAHRGRLNVLTNIMQKSYDEVFTEFEEGWVEDFIEGGGDVKYHRGYSSDVVTDGGEPMRLTLSPNPSHLEFGHSVVLGRARAKQRIRKDSQREQCVPILIHGDASFPGQGIVAEMFNMAHLDGYTVGGALHVVVNNQIGFTTDPKDAHSGMYCTDIAKMIGAPIFHVNGDDPEACAWIATLALQYRQAFKNDVVIDMWCYRRYGHNEGDEPTYTQPLMYERIRTHAPVFETYTRRLLDEGITTAEEVERLSRELKSKMDESQARSKDHPVRSTVAAFKSVWSGLTDDYSDDPVDTAVPRDRLAAVADALGRVPDGFAAHRKLRKLLELRGSCVEQDLAIDWGAGEMLAYGSLLVEGHAVRLTGQDVERGTFSHRHAVIVDQTTGEPHVALNHIAPGQERFCIHNSPLTESACVGFEYGYSLGDPKMLVIWEAQFGDFGNGAQVLFDQFISSAEAKWQRFTGLTILLPHGYEGAGPEHSSARLERFLQLCADDNMQVVYPTTPAQMFHLLRRQMKRNFRKPLIVMTPKSLLRLPEAVSPIDALVNDRFHHVIDDPRVEDPSTVRRLLLCSGKVYYDLAAHRAVTDDAETAIVRLEQLYPFRTQSITPILERYDHVEDVVWVQEEPRNMGAWSFVSAAFRDELDVELRYVGRDAKATPAVASEKMHKQEQHRIMVQAIGLEAEPVAATVARPATAPAPTRAETGAKTGAGGKKKSRTTRKQRAAG